MFRSGFEVFWVSVAVVVAVVTLGGNYILLLLGCRAKNFNISLIVFREAVMYVLIDNVIYLSHVVRFPVNFHEFLS